MRREDFTVGWICAVDIELSAVRGVLDESYKTKLPVPESDKNFYEYGQIGGHKVVFTCLPQMGITQAGIVATRMSSTFPNLRFILMVGVGGGAPSETNDIRLGDIVISKGAGRCSGVVQYDFGKAMENGEFLPTGWLNAPPQILISAASSLKARGKGKLGEDIWNTFATLKHQKDNLPRDFFYPGQEADNLYEFDCLHARDGSNKPKDSCADCDRTKIHRRTPERRPNDHPHIHYGIIASANEVMKDGKKRNEIIQKTAEWAGAEPLCFEMEAAGLMNDFPCLVIRGICDYSDAHKNKIWQPYAAINAAIYARELLKQVSPSTRAGLVGDARETLDSVPTKEIDFIFQYNMPFHIPYPRNTVFTGREKPLEEIHDYFAEQHYDDTPLIYAITGTGGMGKSQIAIEYAYQHLSDYTSVFWVSATNEKTIHTSFVKIMECIVQEHARALWEDSVADYKIIAQKLRLDGLIDGEGRVTADPQFFGHIRSAFFNWLGRERSDNKKWLLIIDNADDLEAYAFQKRECLPTRGSGAILITSRRPEILPEHRTKKMELEGLEIESAVKLLLDSARFEKTTEAVKEQATAIVTELGFMPLAVSQAGYYIRKTKIQLEAYLPLYQQNFTEAQGVKPEFGSSCQETAVTTWEMSFQAIEKQDEEAASILLISAYFNPKEICENIWVDDKDGKPDERVRIRFGKAIALLASYSFVKIIRTGVFSVHPVVQSWARGRLKRDGNSQVLRNAIILLGKVSKWKKLSQKSRKWVLEEERRWTAHVRSLSSHSAPDSFGISTDEAQKPAGDNLYFAFGYIGHLLEKQERYAEAIPWLREVFVGLGVRSDQLERLAVINSIGNSLTHEGKIDEAMTYFQQGLDMLLVKLWMGPHPPPMLTPQATPQEQIFQLMNNLGTAFYRQGPAQYGWALHWYNKAYTWSLLLGEKNMLKYEIRQNSAKVLRKQMNFPGANQECNVVISGLQLWKEKFAKRDNLSSFDAIVRIASLFEDQERYDIAINWYKDALTSFGQGLAESHPHRVKAFGHIGWCLIVLRKPDEALKWYEKALAGLKELNGEDYKDFKYFYLLGKIARCYAELEKYDKAVELALVVLSGREKLLGRKEEPTLEAVDDISEYHFRLGNYDESLRFAQQSLELRKEVHGLNSLATIETMDTLGEIYGKKAEYDKAIYWYGQALDGFQRILGPTNPRTIEVTTEIELLKARSMATIPPRTGYGQAGQQSAYPATHPPQNGYQTGQQSPYPGSPPPPTGQPYYNPMADPRYNQMNPQGQFVQNQYAQNQYPQNQPMQFNPIPQFQNMSFR
ncbi:uncharacterized protein DFL_001138 [Arthrobotrys flagrans]|uniref:Nucleoside phosphorylase domain-containing protein n=1 Tax=Arthrobotrys flagrans TaxID=97331 RepID=A0A437AGA0_ARTFL|nr:hypothetical protein DFL_001138 [Arthrobotrys flagrans]